MKKFILSFISGMSMLAAEPHTVVALLEVQPGSEESFKEAIEHVANMSRQETSCLEYQVVQDAQNPARFALYERWESPELHAAQFEKPYIKDFVANAMPLLAKPHDGVLGKQLTK